MGGETPSGVWCCSSEIVFICTIVACNVIKTTDTQKSSKSKPILEEIDGGRVHLKARDNLKGLGRDVRHPFSLKGFEERKEREKVKKEKEKEKEKEKNNVRLSQHY